MGRNGTHGMQSPYTGSPAALELIFHPGLVGLALMSVLTRHHAVTAPADLPLPSICKIKGPLNFTPRSRRQGVTQPNLARRLLFAMERSLSYPILSTIYWKHTDMVKA